MGEAGENADEEDEAEGEVEMDVEMDSMEMSEEMKDKDMKEEMKDKDMKEEMKDKEKMEEELKEAYSAISTLKTELNEINILNAKLLYSNKIFKAKNLTESQKAKVLNAFDKATTVKEVKLVFETLSEGLNSKAKKSISEGVIGS